MHDTPVQLRQYHSSSKISLVTAHQTAVKPCIRIILCETSFWQFAKASSLWYNSPRDSILFRLTKRLVMTNQS